MSSTYSPDLRLELIGTGDQAGVWGSTTNTNLEYIIEPAVAGYISVSVISSAQALTYINGGSSTPADNQAVYASIALTTVTSADFAVYVPPASKLYVFYNASPYTATIYCSNVIGSTSPNGTGISIPTGKKMSLWTDGTNVYQQSDNFISPALTGTPTAPTATFGTSTTQVATTAFVQAALQALHPVGSIYTSTSSTNPGTAFGFGTWVAYGAGRVLIGNGGGYSAGATGGSADAIVVSHTHTASSSSSFTGYYNSTDLGGVAHTHTFSGSTGGQSANHTHAISISDPGHQHSIGMPGLQAGQYGEIANQALRSQAGWGNAASSTNSNLTDSRTTGISASSAGVSADHSHAYSGTTSSASATQHSHTFTPSGAVATATTVASSGSSGTGANLQPYVVVYMWNRTA